MVKTIFHPDKLMPHLYTYTLIIPHFNIPNLLRRLLRSVPKRNDLQVIVVDDCSTKELNILNEVKKEYNEVEWYDTDTNGGGGKARNIGLDHAKGKYLLFADADDFFTNDFNKILQDYTEDQFDLIYFKAESIDEVTGEKSDRNDGINYLIDKYQLNINGIKQKFTAPWCRIISHDLVELHNIRFKENPVYNDMFFTMCIEQYADKIILDKRYGYSVTKRSDSVSSVTDIRKEISKMRSVKEYYDYAKVNGLNISPLRFLILPMMKEMYKRENRMALRECCNIWSNSGISRNDLKLMYLISSIEVKIYPILSKIKRYLKVSQL